MSLNDGVLDDLGEDNDLIELPSDPIRQRTVAITSDKNQKNDSRINPESIPSPADNVEITTVVNGLKETDELKDIEKTLIGQESISKADFSFLMNYFPKLSKNFSLEEFSERRSRVNYNEVVKDVTRTVSTKEKLAIVIFKTFMEKNVIDVHNFLEKFKHEYVDNLNTALGTSWVGMSLNNLNKKDLVVEFNGDFINVIDVPVNKLSIDAFKPATTVREGFNPVSGSVIAQGILNINKALESQALCYYLDCVKTDKTFELHQIKFHISDHNHTLDELITVFSSNSIFDLVQRLTAAAEERADQLKAMVNQVIEQGDDLDLDYARDFIMKNQIAVDNIFSEANRLAELYNAAMLLSFNLVVIFDALKKF